MTNQEAIAIKVMREKPEQLALKITRNINHCYDCPAFNQCDDMSPKTCAETVEQWLKQKAEIERGEEHD